MSLQWTAVATFLYAEVFLVLLLCVPFVSPARPYSRPPARPRGLRGDLGGVPNPKLWVLNPNLGSLTPIFVPASLLRRLVTLISAQAALGASSQAFRKQAEGASQAARQYLEDNDALRKVQ
ncbi:BAP31 protein, partial [Rhodinocichla rosea]|nr:BAP31 protein [Rhodinocichla rosea]